MELVNNEHNIQYTLCDPSHVIFADNLFNLAKFVFLALLIHT
jgi:hypothetical protein